MDDGANIYRRFLDGDENAFDEIISLYHDSLIFFINRFVKNTSVADDLAVDVFLELLIHKKRFNFSTSLKTYLFMIGRCRALNYIKRERKIDLADISESEYIEDGYISIENKIISDERRRILNSEIDKLPENLKTAVHLIYFEDMSYEEAAKAMKKSKKQIDNFLYRAKNMLRASIEKRGDVI